MKFSENLKHRLGIRLIDHVHEMLEAANFSSMCERFELREVCNTDFHLAIHFGFRSVCLNTTDKRTTRLRSTTMRSSSWQKPRVLLSSTRPLCRIKRRTNSHSEHSFDWTDTETLETAPTTGTSRNCASARTCPLRNDGSIGCGISCSRQLT